MEQAFHIMVPQLWSVEKKTDHVFYVANYPGPVNIGLQCSQSLGLVTLHCSVALNNNKKNIDNLMAHQRIF